MIRLALALSGAALFGVWLFVSDPLNRILIETTLEDAQ
jgi:hypothetical protein